jgi:hypothetical protein
MSFRLAEIQDRHSGHDKSFLSGSDVLKFGWGTIAGTQFILRRTESRLNFRVPPVRRRDILVQFDAAPVSGQIQFDNLNIISVNLMQQFRGRGGMPRDIFCRNHSNSSYQPSEFSRLNMH